MAFVDRWSWYADSLLNCVTVKKLYSVPDNGLKNLIPGAGRIVKQDQIIK